MNKSVNEIEVRLKAIGKNNNVKTEEVKTKYKEKLEEIAKQGIKVNLERIAVNAVMNEYRKIKVKANLAINGKGRFQKREIVKVFGFVTGDSGVWDKADQIRNNAKRYINKNGVQAAVEAQLINGEGKVLDTREKVYGKENIKYLEVLNENCHIRSRTLYGFFKIDGKWKRGNIQTNDNRLALGWSKVKFNTPCEVPAVIKENNDWVSLSSSSAEETLSIFKGVKEDVDIRAVIDEALQGQWTELKDVEHQHELTKDAWNRQIFVKGIVAWIGLDKPTAINTIRMGLMNAENEDELVIVEIPQYLTIDFGELSELYVFGKTRRNKYYNEERELVDGDVSITATDLFPIIATPRESKQDKQQEDVEVSGWID